MDNVVYTLYLIHEDVDNMWVHYGSLKYNGGCFSTRTTELVGIFTSCYEANRLRDEYNHKFMEQEIESRAYVEYFTLDEYKEYSVGVKCTVEATESHSGIEIKTDEDFPRLVPTCKIREMEEYVRDKKDKNKTHISFIGYNRARLQRKANNTMKKLNIIRKTMQELVE